MKTKDGLSFFLGFHLTMCTVDLELNTGDKLYTKGIQNRQTYAPTIEFFSGFKANLMYKKF